MRVGAPAMMNLDWTVTLGHMDQSVPHSKSDTLGHDPCTGLPVEVQFSVLKRILSWPIVMLKLSYPWMQTSCPNLWKTNWRIGFLMECMHYWLNPTNWALSTGVGLIWLGSLLKQGDFGTFHFRSLEYTRRKKYNYISYVYKYASEYFQRCRTSAAWDMGGAPTLGDW